MSSVLFHPAISIAAIVISSIAILSAIRLTVSIVKTNKIKSYEYEFIALQICNICTQSILIASETQTGTYSYVILYEWMQLFSLLSNVGITLVNIKILSIFSVLDDRITVESLKTFRSGVFVLCFLCILPQTIQSIWILVEVNMAMRKVSLITTGVWYFATVIYNNVQGCYLIYVIYRKERKLIKDKQLFCMALQMGKSLRLRFSNWNINIFNADRCTGCRGLRSSCLLQYG
jgi:hypothetical protein